MFYYSNDLYFEHLLEVIEILLLDTKWNCEFKKSVNLNMLNV